MMKSEYYNVTFDTCGSTMVRARSAVDAVSMGELFVRNGRTNVQITTPDARRFSLEEFQASISDRKDYQ